jgi:ribose 5-phosphate isomerase B
LEFDMSEQWRIVIGSDGAGLAYKAALTADLEADPRVTGIIDLGAPRDEPAPYMRVALAAARVVTEGRADRALLICGAGLGAAMSANKVPGIRAVTASDSPSVARSVLDNHAQVLCLGHQVISLDLARRLAREWLGYRFEARSAANVTVIGTHDDTDLARRRRSRPDSTGRPRPPVIRPRPVDHHGPGRDGRIHVVGG